MSLLDEIRAEVKGASATCQLVELLKDDPAAWEATIAATREGIPRAAIVRWLKKRNPEVTEHSVDKHFRRECPCQPS